MKSLHKYSAGLLFGALALLMSTGAWAGGLTDLNGHSRSIGDYAGKGKWLIVMIWASDCHICNIEAHNYVDFQTFHGDKDATILGISMDGMAKKAAAESFIKRHSVNFPNLIGAPEDVAGMYTQLTGAPFQGTPTFLVYDPAGKLLAQQVGAVPTDLIEGFIKSHTKAQAASVQGS